MNKQIFFSNSDYDIIMTPKSKPIPPISEEVAKRSRGRPKKAVLESTPLIQEPEPEPNLELEPIKRRRGRPIGSLKAKSLITCIIGHGC